MWKPTFESIIWTRSPVGIIETLGLKVSGYSVSGLARIRISDIWNMSYLLNFYYTFSSLQQLIVRTVKITPRQWRILIEGHVFSYTFKIRKTRLKMEFYENLKEKGKTAISLEDLLILCCWDFMHPVPLFFWVSSTYYELNTGQIINFTDNVSHLCHHTLCHLGPFVFHMKNPDHPASLVAHGYGLTSCF